MAEPQSDNPPEKLDARESLAQALITAIKCELPNEALEVGRTSFTAAQKMLGIEDESKLLRSDGQKQLIPLLMELASIQTFSDLPDEEKLVDGIGAKISDLLIRGFTGSEPDSQLSQSDHYIFNEGKLLRAILPDLVTHAKNGKNQKAGDSLLRAFASFSEPTETSNGQDSNQIARSHLWLIDLIYTYKTYNPKVSDSIFNISGEEWTKKAEDARAKVDEKFILIKPGTIGDIRVIPVNDFAQKIDAVLVPYQIRFYDQTAAGTGGTPFFKPMEDLGYEAWERWHGYIREIQHVVGLPQSKTSS